MTPWGLLAAFRRRWPVVVLGLFATCVLGWHAKNAPDVYFGQVNVMFLAPQKQQADVLPINGLQQADSNLIATAGVIGKVVNDNLPQAHTASSTATLLGQGVTKGYSVLLPDGGGQWDHSFTQAELNVQATGPTSQYVAQTLRKLVAEINRRLVQRQQAVGASRANMIHTQLSPPVLDIRMETPQPLRALAVAVLLGGSGTLALVLLISRRSGDGRPPRRFRIRARGGVAARTRPISA
jgi:hypothetical protein